MLSALAPASPAALAVLALCFLLVILFEFSNGFHDTANAVATVIYTHALRPIPAVLLSGTMNFLGVLLGGIAVAYTLVELLPPDVLTPPDGNPAIGMLMALFLSALIWNVLTWWRGIPCSSSHAIIGALLGVGVANSLLAHRGFGNGVDWGQVWGVFRALLVSPLLGFILAGLLFRLVRLVIHDRHLTEPTTEGNPPTLWVRALLICTCGGVSFAHGSNDGQKSIGLIMLTVIGLFPVATTLNFDMPPQQVAEISIVADRAVPLIQRFGDDEKQLGVEAAQTLSTLFRSARSMGDVPPDQRARIRDDFYRLDIELKLVAKAGGATPVEKQQADTDRTSLHGAVEYAPIWVRVLSALCLGVGTMVGYRRIVATIGEKIGRAPLTPAQGASAELVAAALIGSAGFSGLPVSTTHIVSSGVAGTMAGSGAGVQGATIRQIIIAWVLTLPATFAMAAGFYYVLTV